MLNRPPAGDHFCGAKVLLQKEKHPYGCLSFWSGRRGSLAALPGRHTHTGTKTCHRHVFLAALAPFRASARLDKKRNHYPDGWWFPFWSGRRGSLAALPGRHTHTGTKTCHRHVFLAALVPFRASARLDQKNTTLMGGVFLERATRLELATSTLARSRSTR